MFQYSFGSQVSQQRGLLLPGEAASITLSVLVDKKASQLLNLGTYVHIVNVDEMCNKMEISFIILHFFAASLSFFVVHEDSISCYFIYFLSRFAKFTKIINIEEK